VNLEGQPQGFDANGNLTSINAVNSLAYDYENRLVQTVLDGTTDSFQYSGVGDRMAAIRGGWITRFMLDRGSPLTQVLAETDTDGAITAYYIYGLGLISRIDSGGNAQYYHFDSRGSTVALTDATGQITDAYAYDPFGRPRGVSGNTDNRFRYLGRHGVLVEDGSFLYIRARYYSTKRGRFITKDPVTGKDGDSQSLNRYIYALNNPVRLIDVNGFCSQEGAPNISGFSQPGSAGNDAILALLQQIVLNAAKEGVSHVTEGYLTGKLIDVLLSKGIAPEQAGQFTGTVLGKGLPIAGLFMDMVNHYLDMRATVQDRSSLEDGIVFFTDLGAEGVIGLTSLIPFAGPFVAVGLSSGYDQYHAPIMHYVEHNPVTDFGGSILYNSFHGTGVGSFLGF